MKKIITNALIALIFLAGLGLVCYPTLSNWYNEKVGSYSIQTYQEAVDDTPYEKYAAMLAQAREYNSTLTGDVDTFVSGAAEGEDYINALNVSNGMMGALVIEKIGVSLPIYHGTNEAVLQHSIGHLEGTALPTGENGEHAALTGHTGLPSATLLTDLTKLEIGDGFAVHVLNEVYTYEVFNILVVEPHELDALAAVADKNLVTLITCTPYGVNSHRLFVQGELVSNETLTNTPTVGDETTATAPETEVESSMPAWAEDFAMLCATGMAEGLRTATNAFAALQASALLRYWPFVLIAFLLLIACLIFFTKCKQDKQSEQGESYADAKQNESKVNRPASPSRGATTAPKHYATGKVKRTAKRVPRSTAKQPPKHYAL